MLATFDPIRVKPAALTYDLLLTADTAISHHDPAVQDDSNRMLFNRQKQLLPTGLDLPPLAWETVETLSQAHPVPPDMVDLVAELSFAEFVATALVRTFLDIYNRGDGHGVFTGMERFERLAPRLHHAAIEAPTLRAFWDRLGESLQVPVHASAEDDALLHLLLCPAVLQQQALRVLAKDYRSTLAVARLWHQQRKLGDAEYAAKAGGEQTAEPVVIDWPASKVEYRPDAALVVEVPQVQPNTLRHVIVREPSWWHLCDALGLAPTTPGRGEATPGAEAIFYNGGNIASGAKQPSNTFGLSWQARETYPSLDLLGGVTDSFDLGESRLKVAAYLVCRENQGALLGSAAADLPTANVSVFDLLDDVTLTRQAGRVGTGQMIFSFETLCPGTQILFRMSLPPSVPTLTRGALLAAVEWFLANDRTVAGSAARGFGWVRGEWLASHEGDDDALRAYESYLAEHRENLLEGLRMGTLGTSMRILS